MKNIRILEDGNRLIVVLEGYEKSAVNALIEMIGTVSTPLSHIKPHTGEADFHLKGTEKEVPFPNQAKTQETEKEAGTGIKRPAFMEQMQAGKEAVAKNATTEKATKPANTANTVKASGDTKPVKAAEAKKAEVPPVQQEVPEDFMPIPGTPEKAEDTKPVQTAADPEAPEETKGDASAAKAETEKTEEAVDGVKAEAEATPAAPTAQTAPAAPARAKAPVKPTEFMNSFELRTYIQQADKGKLSMLLRRKGRFPNIACLLNADDRTLREYVKELILAA